VFISVLVAGIVYQDWLKETVLSVVLYVVWVGGQAFRSFGQRLLWVVALTIALIFAVIHASRRSTQMVYSATRSAESRARLQGRIRDWVIQIRISSGSAYAPVYRNRELRRLLLNTLAHNEKIEPEIILEKIRSGELELPESVRFIFNKERRAEQQPEPRLGLVDQIRLFWFSLTNRLDSKPFRPDERLYEAAAYLEAIMEEEYEF